MYTVNTNWTMFMKNNTVTLRLVSFNQFWRKLFREVVYPLSLQSLLTLGKTVNKYIHTVLRKFITENTDYRTPLTQLALGVL